MSENKHATSGAASATSGADGEASTATTETESSGLEKVDRALYEKVLKEKRNTAAKNAELQDALKSFKDEQLKKEAQYKTLYEQTLKEKQELEAWKDQNRALQEKAKKFAAVKKHLMQMGLKPEHEDLALNKLLDVEDLVVDPETQVVLGAEEKAKSFRQTYSSLGIFGQKAPGVNQNAPSVGTASPKTIDSKMSREQILEVLKKTGLS